MMNRLIFLIVLSALIVSCHTNPSNIAHKHVVLLNGKYLTEKQIGNIIIKLDEANDSTHVYKLIDSLIAFNGQTGFIVFERGVINNYYSKYNAAVSDFRLAEKLNYNHDKCQIMIAASESMRK